MSLIELIKRGFLTCAGKSTGYNLKKCSCEILLFVNISKVYSDHSIASLVHAIYTVAEAFAICLINFIFLAVHIVIFNAANIRFQCELITVLN